MANTAERFSELLESIGTTENDTERHSAGDRSREGWEQFVDVKNAASNREEVDNMQQSSKIVRRGSNRGHKSGIGGVCCG